ncbi:hypothetical protein D0860_06158 [Hortaea werneckii]|uniref:Protein kinase domain-containing protein n=1 Tax=Hortaea werneckii TaxID=91943 RepID=A0A3M7GVX9_HORWE|nr:hypothetical protein D0860_06158 [Hortaea werneckii]
MASPIRVGQTVKASKGIYTITRKLHDHVWVARSVPSSYIVSKRRCIRSRSYYPSSWTRSYHRRSHIPKPRSLTGLAIVNFHRYVVFRRNGLSSHLCRRYTVQDLTLSVVKLMSLLWGRGFHIFKPIDGVSADDPDFPAHVLMEQARYFGPFPLRYKELLDEESESILAAIHVLIKQQRTRKPFLLVEDEEVLPEDKEFLCDVMKLDPLERPTARELLQDRWFDGL